MAKDNIEIGALGWTHQAWDSAYYPEDLPEDWRLDYYSHHFQFVLMQAQEWMHCSESDIEQWLEDVKDSFEFFLGLSVGDINESALEQIGRIKGILNKRLCGLVIFEDGNVIEPSMLQGLSALAPVYLDTDAVNESFTGVRCCWRKGRDVNGCKIGFLRPDAAKDMRNMRAHIEAFIEQGGTQQLYLVYQGQAPSTKAMQDAQIILQMLV